MATLIRRNRTSLLLDEHYAPQIAAQLRDRGHDVMSVKERPDLIAASDADLLERMASEHRVITTENVADFVPLANEVMLSGGEHGGLLLTSPHSMPRSAKTIGLFVRSLAAFFASYQHNKACRDQILWLHPVSR